MPPKGRGAKRPAAQTGRQNAKTGAEAPRKRVNATWDDMDVVDDLPQLQHVEPQQSPPDPRLLTKMPDIVQKALLQDHLDPSSRVAWHQTCQEGEQQVMTHANDVSLWLMVRGARHDRAALQTANATLNKWGRQLRTLHVAFAYGETCAHHLPPLLATLAAPLRHLDLRVPVTPDLLTAASTAFPTLTQLTIANHCPTLPAPTAFPHLTDLTITEEAETSVHSVAHYVQQLKKLSYHTDQHANVAQLFAEPTKTLQRVDLPATTLDGVILGRMLAHAPAVEQLAARTLDLKTVDLMSHTWLVKALSLTECPSGAFVQLAALPLCVTGKTTVHFLEPGQATIDKPKLTAATASLTPRVQNNYDVRGMSALHLDIPDPGASYQPCSIQDLNVFRSVAKAVSARDTLMLLDSLGPALSARTIPNTAAPSSSAATAARLTAQQVDDAPGWDLALTACPIETISALGVSQLTLHCVLDDRLVGALVCGAPNTERLTVPGMDLSSHVNADLQWRLLQLIVTQGPVRASQMTMLPDHVGRGGCTVYLSRDGMTCDVHEDKVRQKLQAKVCYVAMPKSGLVLLADSVLVTNKKAATAALRQVFQLPVCDYQCRFSRKSDPEAYSGGGKWLTLWGWEVTEELMATLGRMPRWFKLRMERCTWPLQPDAYKPLLAHLPIDCCKVSITPYPGLELVRAVVTGAPNDCVYLGLPYEQGLRSTLIHMRRAVRPASEGRVMVTEGDRRTPMRPMFYLFDHPADLPPMALDKATF